MNYIWTEDTGAGFHFWELVNKYLFHGGFSVESKGSNQGILDAARKLGPKDGDRYYLAFDIVYDNMDVMNKYLELREIAAAYPGQIVILDMVCFEYLILSFGRLTEWTGTGKKDKVAVREDILAAMDGHRIDTGRIADGKTKEYLMGFKRFSTERVIKAVTYELTENDEWSVKGKNMGKCWHRDCCVVQDTSRVKCGMAEGMSGDGKIMALLEDAETQRVLVPCTSQRPGF